MNNKKKNEIQCTWIEEQDMLNDAWKVVCDIHSNAFRVIEPAYHSNGTVSLTRR